MGQYWRQCTRLPRPWSRSHPTGQRADPQSPFTSHHRPIDHLNRGLTFNNLPRVPKPVRTAHAVDPRRRDRGEGVACCSVRHPHTSRGQDCSRSEHVVVVPRRCPRGLHPSGGRGQSEDQETHDLRQVAHHGGGA